MLVIYLCGQFDLPELFVSVGLDLLLALDDEAQGPARSIAVARLGPNGLKIENETTHFIVRWTRVASMA